MKPEGRQDGEINSKVIAVLLMAVLFTWFLLQNSAALNIHFLFWKGTISEILVFLGSLAIGLIIGLLIRWKFSGKKRK